MTKATHEQQNIKNMKMFLEKVIMQESADECLDSNWRIISQQTSGRLGEISIP